MKKMTEQREITSGNIRRDEFEYALRKQKVCLKTVKKWHIHRHWTNFTKTGKK